MARKPRTRAPYRMVSDTTWVLARADYLGGMTAEAAAEKHDIGIHNMRQTMARKGWTKRALAEARTFPGPGGPDPVADPAAAPAAAPAAPEPWGELPAGVLGRAREALLAGRGAEATALLKALREYVLVRQDVSHARDAVAWGIARWDAAQPARAGEVTEPLIIQTLHGFWSRLSDGELADRCDPHGEMGFKAFLESLAPGVMAAKWKARG